MKDWTIRPCNADDKAWIKDFLAEQWGSEIVIVHGTVFHPHELPGFVAVQTDERLGLATYHITEGECEIVTLNSTHSGLGIGGALIEAVKEQAQEAGCRRLWLITTNDNLDALGFYQRRGFELVKINRHAVDESRKLKPQIPAVGEHGIPLRDEIELEITL